MTRQDLQELCSKLADGQSLLSAQSGYGFAGGANFGGVLVATLAAVRLAVGVA